MKAPKKICIIEYPDGLSRYWVSKKRDDVVATLFHEYLNKDALLEWAKELNFLVKDEPGASFKGAEVVINEVIKKIQSL